MNWHLEVLVRIALGASLGFVLANLFFHRLCGVQMTNDL
jgi:hypothetical protein